MKGIVNLFFLLSIPFFVAAQKTTTAEQLITNAIAKAKKENKKVFVKYTATWCGWCHKMDTAMQDTTVKKLFDNNYIVVRLHVNEFKDKQHLNTPGSDSLLSKHGGNEQGLPYWVILNPTDNKVLANSKKKPEDKALTDSGDNVGCPTQKEEIAYFIRVLQTTGTFTKVDLEKIEKVFSKIE